MVTPVGMGIFGSFIQGQELENERRARSLQNLAQVIGIGGNLQNQQYQAQMNPLLLQAMQKRLNAPDPLLNVGAGSHLVDPVTRQPVFSAPFRPEPTPQPAPFTLGPGQQRFAPGGGPPIASVPPNPMQPVQPPPPIVQTDEAGRTRILDRGGNLIRDLGVTGKPTAQFANKRAAEEKMRRDLSSIIPTLEEISKDGGLLDKATGSGAGAAVDIAAGFFGVGTPGAIAVGQLKPATDAVLKLVPRFEGPQSDKDTKSYQDAAGNLSNPNTPNSVKKAAAKEILRIYKERQGQFVTRDYEAATGGSRGILEEADAIIGR